MHVEKTMENPTDTPFPASSPRRDPRAWTGVKRDIIHRAHEARSQMVKALAIGFSRAITAGARSLIQRTAQAWTDWKAGVLARRQDREAIARLTSLDDIALKDIGIQRNEIESIVRAHGHDDTRQRRDQKLAA
jgi:uncharacterized protein YjiS (DUF1127 family)